MAFYSHRFPAVDGSNNKSSLLYPLQYSRLKETGNTTVGRGIASPSASTRQPSFKASFRHPASSRIFPLDRPPDPSSFSSQTIQHQAKTLFDWMKDKTSVVCLTGAGISTESGIPDYRGSKGSYHDGHKPIIHHHFMTSESTQKRYWARSLVGYPCFHNARPNLGHDALARLEKLGHVGVSLTDVFDLSSRSSSISDLISSWERYEEGERKLSVITQNVDNLHSKAGLQNVLHLHGRGDIVKCMNCGTTRCRMDYHDQLLELNKSLVQHTNDVSNVPNIMNSGSGAKSKLKKATLRPDGDAELNWDCYDDFILPSCPVCTSEDTNEFSEESNDALLHTRDQKSFYKTDVVFFGDSVPRHRVDISNAAIDAADGLLCIGTSLAVHSAFRLAKRAIERGVPLAILNVGETRLEKEGLVSSNGDNNGRCSESLVTKVESPIGETLAALVTMFDQ